MTKSYSYVVARDYGFAPNPFNGILTLAACKPVIRKGADVGSFVIGFTNKENGNKLLYMMKVSEVCTFDQYWKDSRFLCKRPTMNGSLKSMYGDNIALLRIMPYLIEKEIKLNYYHLVNVI